MMPMTGRIAEYIFEKENQVSDYVLNAEAVQQHVQQEFYRIQPQGTSYPYKKR